MSYLLTDNKFYFVLSIQNLFFSYTPDRNLGLMPPRKKDVGMKIKIEKKSPRGELSQSSSIFLIQDVEM